MRIGNAVILAVVGTLAVGGLGACGDDGDDSGASAGGVDGGKPPVVLLLTAPKIPGADLLTGQKAGAEAAAAKLNAEGGIGGREVEITTCNTQMQPAVSTVCAHKTLRKEKPTAQIGCDLSWGSSGLKVFSQSKIPSFNCQNTKEDFTNEWAFGINASQVGGRRGASRWLCTRPEVKRVLLMTYDSPDQRATALPALNPILKGCGKTTGSLFFPLSGGDMTPYIQKAVRFKPDFIVLSTVGSTAVSLFKGFAQNGVPASKITVPDTAFDWEVVSQAGSAMNGAYSQAQYASWGDASNPDVAAYLKTMKRFSKADPRDPNVQWGYQFVTFVAEAAKKIGADKLNGESLAEFARTANGFHIPLSRAMVNPGPKGYPQQKQPYIRIERYEGNGKFSPVEAGKDGWFLGY